MSKLKSETRQEMLKRHRGYKNYGLKKIPQGTKLAWISSQNKHGWSLGLALNKHTLWLRNVRFRSKKEVKRALERTTLVFVQMKNNPEE